MEDNGYVLGTQGGRGAKLIRTVPDTTIHVNSVLLDPAFPSQFVVAAPYPNPFNSTVTIRYSVGAQGLAPLRLGIYDTNGREVAEIDPPYPPCNSRGGLQSLVWNASGVLAGQYIIKLANGNYSATKTVTLIK